MKRVACIGDLHFSDRYQGKHKDYLENCIDVFKRYTDKLKELKPDVIILTGDIIGLREKTLYARESLLYISQQLSNWKSLCNGELYSLKGNHDIGSTMTDFDFLSAMGLFKVQDTLDVDGLRLHMFNYGDEYRAIELKKDGCNIGIAHANLMIDGKTNWYRAGEGIQLSSLKNMKGIDLIFAGHIHNPSPEVVSTSIEDVPVSLLYLGNATRPARADTWESVYIGVLDVEDDNVSLETVLMPLSPAGELFNETFEDSEDDADAPIDASSVIDIETLTEVLDEINKYQLGSDIDYHVQVRKYAGTDTELVKKADYFLELAHENCK